MYPPIIRPKLGSEKRREIEDYLLLQWERAVASRNIQIDQHYVNWMKSYYAIPAESTRNVPWPGASNMVVPLTRMFIDTFVARTLNIVHATRPLLQIEGFPAEIREGLETYNNWKWEHDWDAYTLNRDMLMRGNKSGTVMVKTAWRYEQIYAAVPSQAPRGYEPQPEICHDGPNPRCIAFEDYFCYPITANRADEIQIHFHRLRWTQEQARLKMDRGQDYEGKWDISAEELESALEQPADLKRDEERESAGIDSEHRELQSVEAHFRHDLGGKRYQLCAVIIPKLNRLVDLYFNPYYSGQETFVDYRPFPREDLFFGDSMARLLEQAQEEVSKIHNDRRNLATLKSAPFFLAKDSVRTFDGKPIWYPGKMWKVDEIDDFKIESVNVSYSDMLGEENFAIELAQQLTGISGAQMAAATGQQGKKGIYNAAGTMAVLAEGNQRQHTNIRDFRYSFSRVARSTLLLQAMFGPDDPAIALMPPDDRQKVAEAIGALISYGPQKLAISRFEVKASDPAHNKEVHKAALIELAQLVSQYGQATAQMAATLVENANLNPILRDVYSGLVSAQRDLMSQLVREFDMEELAQRFPDVVGLIKQQQQQQQQLQARQASQQRLQGNGQAGAGNPPNPGQQPPMGGMGPSYGGGR
jgi:hypothetical protein